MLASNHGCTFIKAIYEFIVRIVLTQKWNILCVKKCNYFKRCVRSNRTDGRDLMVIHDIHFPITWGFAGGCQLQPNNCLNCPDCVRLICLSQPIRLHTVCDTHTSLGLKCFDCRPVGWSVSVPARDVQTVRRTQTCWNVLWTHMFPEFPPLTASWLPLSNTDH